MSQFKNLPKAAALRYNPNGDNAPIVVASGMGHIATKIVDMAQQNNIPVYHDDSLASLLSQMQSGSEIPPELYAAVVDIYVYFLNFTAQDIETEQEKKD
ncbi:MAG: EscU/YscU/HrcU family type III secretion system export apparatus switch protein [Clostridiales bacterium]|nr:EscU/YscU/HrcU family type III secretion system export apparatus switch protein [Clostridiales bacterium]